MLAFSNTMSERLSASVFGVTASSGAVTSFSAVSNMLAKANTFVPFSLLSSLNVSVVFRVVLSSDLVRMARL